MIRRDFNNTSFSAATANTAAEDVSSGSDMSGDESDQKVNNGGKALATPAVRRIAGEHKVCH